MNKLFLYFPQWQGSGKTNEIYTGASVLKKHLSKKIKFIEIRQPQNENLDTVHNIIGYKRILNNLNAVKKVLENSNPDYVYTLGGDCGIEVMPVTYLNAKYHQDLLVLWFDAHGDLNTPESSPSNTFHGMPLRMILGEGDEKLKKRCLSSLTPHQIALLDTRDLDLPELEFIRNNNLTIITPRDINIENLSILIRKKGKKHLYIHLDLDVIDPDELHDVKSPTPNGVSISNIEQLIKILKSRHDLAGASLVEYAPRENNVDSRVVKLAKSLFTQ